MARKRWQQAHARGAALDGALVRELASGPVPGPTPVRVERGGEVVVHYRRPRMHLDRAAWESLPAGGVLLVHIVAPNDGGPEERVALTREELERVFGEVRGKPCWSAQGCYHFPSRPRALASFVVPIEGADLGSPPPPAPGRARSQSASNGSPVGTRSRPRTSEPGKGPGPPPSAQSLFRSSSPAVLAPPLGRSPSLAGWLRAWEAHLGTTVESEEYRESVRAWRNAWRPSRVRVLLIAESHVGPRPGDERVRVTVPNGRELPSSYCRLVYCLGYGEPHLCSPQPQANAGTRPFWNIVAAIALGPGIVQPTGSTIGPMRVQWKLGVLRRLRDAGVWLVDASVLPLYDPTRPRNRKKIIAGHGYRRIVRESFTQFVWPEVADEPLEQVWIIGRGVERAIREVVGRRLTGVLEQPGPGRGQHARHIEGLTRLAESVRALGG